VLCGVCFLGDRPTLLAWLGICVTVPALWLVSGGETRHGAGATPATVDGLLASLGVAVQYIGLAQASAGSGVWPVVAGRVAAVVVVLPGVWRHGPQFRQSPKALVQAVVIGAGAALGLILYLWATRLQMLALAVVLASLYPAIPTVLGLAMLHEKVSRRQLVGLVSAGTAIVLLTLG
jgi:drug/metabolite transporter (DMT)-like permease